MTLNDIVGHYVSLKSDIYIDTEDNQKLLKGSVIFIKDFYQIPHRLKTKRYYVVIIDCDFREVELFHSYTRKQNLSDSFEIIY